MLTPSTAPLGLLGPSMHTVAGSPVEMDENDGRGALFIEGGGLQGCLFSEADAVDSQEPSNSDCVPRCHMCNSDCAPQFIG